MAVCGRTEASGRPEALSLSCDQFIVDLVRLQEILGDNDLIGACELQKIEQLQAGQRDDDERKKDSNPRVIGRVSVELHLYSIEIEKPEEAHCIFREDLEFRLGRLIRVIIVFCVFFDFVEFFLVVGEMHDGEKVGKKRLSVF